MKERPVNFKACEVRATQDGRKTQFRRIINPQPRLIGDGVPYGDSELTEIPSCPFGAPGDRLWVREAFRLFDSSKECACYDMCSCSRYHGKPVYRGDYPDDEGPWRSPVCMPRKLSRITLEVVSVRVEQLNDISEEDAIAEGAENGFYDGPYWEPSDDLSCEGHRDGYRIDWQSVHGPDSWDANPWVWVVEFKVV